MRVGFTLSTFWRRLLLLVAIPHIAFLLLSLPTTAPFLIGLLNAISLSLSVGVCVAFIPAMLAIFFKPHALERGDYLSLGIWITWFAVIMQAAWSIAWRARGMPLWMASTDFTSYFLFTRVCGAIFHLAAPAAINDQIPPRRWIMIGILIAVAVALAILVSYMVDLLAMRDFIPERMA